MKVMETGERMEQYLKGLVKAFGHRCGECRFFNDMRCNNPHVKGRKTRETLYGDSKYMKPEEEACNLFDGDDDYGDET